MTTGSATITRSCPIPRIKQMVYNVLDNALEASPNWVGWTCRMKVMR